MGERRLLAFLLRNAPFQRHTHTQPFWPPDLPEDWVNDNRGGSILAPFEAYAYRRSWYLPGGDAALLIDEILTCRGRSAHGNAKAAADRGGSVAHSRTSATSSRTNGCNHLPLT